MRERLSEVNHYYPFEVFSLTGDAQPYKYKQWQS